MVEKISNEICEDLKKVDLSLSIEVVNQKALEAIQAIYQSNEKQIQDLYIEYSKADKKKSATEISRLVGQDITYTLMKDCEPYLRITMFKNQPIPQISATTDSIGNDFTELLNEEIKTEAISQSLVDKCMVRITDKYAKTIENEYGDRFSLEFINEFQAYLMTRCEPYMRWTASLIK